MLSFLNPIYAAVAWVIVAFHSIFGLILGKNNHESLKW